MAENSKEYLIGILKDKYDHEMVRKSDFESSLNIPITLLTALLAGMYFVTSDTTIDSTMCSLKTIKLILLTILFMSCIVTIIFLFIVYFGYRRSYCTFPESNVVVNVDFKELEEYNKEHNADKYEESLLETLRDRVVAWYLNCNNHNTPVNDRRANALYFARMFLLISIGIGLILLIFICIIKTF